MILKNWKVKIRDIEIERPNKRKSQSQRKKERKKDDTTIQIEKQNKK